MSRLASHQGPRSFRPFGWAALGALLLGCSETAVPLVGFAHPTLVEVSPDDFLGTVPCTPSPGAMRRYVATVYDLGPAGGEGGQSSGGDESQPATEFALPSSTLDRGSERAEPIPCTESVGFANVVPGNRYRAVIEGYDRDDLVALAPGLRVLYDPQTLERVEPRWTGNCGKEAPVTSREFVVRRIGNCASLEDATGAAEALVEVRVDGALAGLECGSSEGTVERFEVVAPDGTTVGAACGEAVTLRGLEPGPTTLNLPLRAFEAGATDHSWGTTCLVQVVPGVTSTATCLPLSSTGTVEIDPRAALTALGLECDAEAFEELEVGVDGDQEDEPRYVRPDGCGRPLRFQGLEAGPVTARAMARFADRSSSPVALCTAVVAPGETAVAVCTEAP